jgi:hypothetical protein
MHFFPLLGLGAGIAAIAAIPACRPPYSSQVRSTDTGPQGLAAATSLTDLGNGLYKVVCLDKSEGTTTADEIADNKVCIQRAAASPTNATAPADAGSDSLTLYFGAPTYVKKSPIDCTGGAPCVENENSCRINVTNSAVAFSVKSVAVAPEHAYDHIVAERSATQNCKLTSLYIYFPHLVVPIKFAASTPVNANCVLPAGTTITGAIQRNPNGKQFNFWVAKGASCVSAGDMLNALNFDSLSSPSAVVRAILGQ